MNNIIMYVTNSCGKCKILKGKIDDKQIEYDVCDDIEVMKAKGIRTVPVLEIDGEMMGFGGAVAWVNNYKGEDINE
jgi:glutaredoxin